MALEPLPRGDSRMLVAKKLKSLAMPETLESQSLADDLNAASLDNGASQNFLHQHSRQFHEHLNPGDVLVLNNTRVIPARLRGRSENGAEVEILLVRRDYSTSEYAWSAMVKPGPKFKPGRRFYFGEELEAEVLSITEGGHRVLKFNLDTDKKLLDALNKYGEVPLPPYINRKLKPEDLENYQSVFAQHEGSVAAPTASLHLSHEQLDVIKKKAVRICYVTLHVGPGTFMPIQSEEIENHPMHEEWFEFRQDCADAISEAKAKGGKIWAVGTTVARVLETVAEEDVLAEKTAFTRKYIYPGYQWKLVDGLLTNFHWPKSSLFVLVSSLLGVNGAQKAYLEAINQRYRFFSYGDSMLIY